MARMDIPPEIHEAMDNKFDKYSIVNSWEIDGIYYLCIYSKKCLGKNRISSIEELRQRTNAWNKEVNKKKIKIQWKFTTKEARKKFKYDD